MSKPNMLSGLQKSTKITIIACACFLALTALILLFLMFFPIEPEQKIIMQNNQPAQTEEINETALPSEEWQNTEAPHTLSTWSASVEGHSHSPNEYWEYMRSTTYEAQETDETEDTGMSETSIPEFTTDTMEWQESTTEDYDETGVSGMESSEYTHSDSQTQTETVLPPDVSEPPQTEYQPPVVTDPPQTDPPAVVDPEPEQPAEI